MRQLRHVLAHSGLVRNLPWRDESSILGGMSLAGFQTVNLPWKDESSILGGMSLAGFQAVAMGRAEPAFCSNTQLTAPELRELKSPAREEGSRGRDEAGCGPKGRDEAGWGQKGEEKEKWKGGERRGMIRWQGR